MFSKLCFHLKDLLKNVRLLLAALSGNGLTHSCPRVSLEIALWFFDTFENNLEMIGEFTIY